MCSQNIELVTRAQMTKSSEMTKVTKMTRSRETVEASIRPLQREEDLRTDALDMTLTNIRYLVLETAEKGVLAAGEDPCDQDPYATPTTNRSRVQEAPARALPAAHADSTNGDLYVLAMGQEPHNWDLYTAQTSRRCRALETPVKGVLAAPKDSGDRDLYSAPTMNIGQALDTVMKRIRSANTDLANGDRYRLRQSPDDVLMNQLGHGSRARQMIE
ncbi:hypothetical protein HOY80DRAFT_1029247 [Tuber brumale]|nr:hypothetical protein HOY80DRAFT_1029247 [Tuber brumale]